MLYGSERYLTTLARHLALTTTCALAVGIGAGCSDAIAPSATSGAFAEDVVVRSSHADRSPEVTTAPVSFFAFNPCTGVVEQFFGNATLRLQEFLLSTDPVRGHRVVRVTEDLETVSGFSGISTSTVVFNGIPGSPPEQAAFTGEQTVQLDDESGRRLVVQILIHATFVDGEFVVEFESLNERCVSGNA